MDHPQKVTVIKMGMSRREQIARLQEEISTSLEREGAKTSVPCPVADQIFEQLFGRLWLQCTIIGKHRSAEELLKLLKLDYDATIEFYRQRRESTLKRTVHPEDDKDLVELEQSVLDCEKRTEDLKLQLSYLEDQEKAEMSRWLTSFGVSQLVHAGRIDTLNAQTKALELRFDLLHAEGDLLADVPQLIEWSQNIL